MQSLFATTGGAGTGGTGSAARTANEEEQRGERTFMGVWGKMVGTTQRLTVRARAGKNHAGRAPPSRQRMQDGGGGGVFRPILIPNPVSLPSNYIGRRNPTHRAVRERGHKKPGRALRRPEPPDAGGPDPAVRKEILETWESHSQSLPLGRLGLRGARLKASPTTGEPTSI